MSVLSKGGSISCDQFLISIPDRGTPEEDSGILLDLPLTRPALMPLGSSFVRSGIN